MSSERFSELIIHNSELDRSARRGSGLGQFRCDIKRRSAHAVPAQVRQ